MSCDRIFSVVVANLWNSFPKENRITLLMLVKNLENIFFGRILRLSFLIQIMVLCVCVQLFICAHLLLLVVAFVSCWLSYC